MWVEITVAAAGLATMRAAIDRGDIDEASRQGVLAGPTVIEQGLASADRPAQLAAIAASPAATDSAGLLDPLARVASSPDRRVAIPAARAALEIARDLGSRELPDDLALEDVATWRQLYSNLARDPDRWIELRVIALDTAAALDPGGTGVDLGLALDDSDPAFRLAAVTLVAMPVPIAARATLATTVTKDLDDDVALAAAAVLCGDLAVDPAKPILDALGTAGIDRIKILMKLPGPRGRLRDAARCLRR